MLLTFALALPLILYIVVPLKKTMRYIAAFFVTVILFSLFAPSVYQGYLFSKRGIEHVGVVTGKDCGTKNTEMVSYKFTVDAKEFPGSGRPGPGNQGCDRLNIGDQVFITYLPGAEMSSAPSKTVGNGLYMFILSAPLFFIFLLWIGNAQEKFRKRKN
jgi:hypothetical protein